MKTARMILTATMLLSLNATSYCSQSQNSANDVITAPRQNSHDGTRDGLFGSWSDTLDKLGKPYGNQIYALGSDEKAPERWAHAGKQITKFDHAIKFMKAITAKGWSLPQEALTPSTKIIQGHYSQQKKEADALIAAAVIRLQAFEATEKELAAKLRTLQVAAIQDQTKCNDVLPFDPIDNSFSKGKQLNDGNIRSFISEKARSQRASK